MEIIQSNPPDPRAKTSRMNEAMKNLKPGESVIVTTATARCIAAYFRYHGGSTVVRKINETQSQVWVTE